MQNENVLLERIMDKIDLSVAMNKNGTIVKRFIIKGRFAQIYEITMENVGKFYTFNIDDKQTKRDIFSRDRFLTVEACEDALNRFAKTLKH
jgi:hypothetical protein